VLVLALDTATSAVTAGLAWIAGAGVEVRAERVTVDARKHGEVLAPAIQDSLAEIGAKPHDLAAIVAGVGPGPFTGLRVGLVTAAALADSLGIPAYGVCTLDAVVSAADAASLAADAAYLVATDARRREVYWATYQPDGKRLTGPAVDKPAAVHDWLAGQESPPSWAAGSGARLYADVLGLPVRDPEYPSVRLLAERAADRVLAGAPADPLTPLYLRRPDAVEPTVRKAVRT
jgi:tRNA threonylcarbamoyl adenosine modification protein YeaZ